MDGLTSLFRAVVEVSLAMSLVMAVLLLCRPLFKKRYRAGWAYWAWLLVAARLLIPVNLSLPSVTPVSIPEPGVSVNLPVAFERKNKAPVEGPIGQPGSDSSPVGGASGDVAAGNPLPITAAVVMDGWTVVACLWLTGLACALILQFVPYFRFRRQVGRWSTELAAPEFDALRDQLDAPGLRLAACGAVASPMVSGFLRPALLVPAEGELPPEPILRHEIVHYKRRDLWYKLLLLLCQCVHWFNPLVWLMGAAANRDLERSCDEQVTEGRPEEYRAGYGRAILDAVDAAAHRSAPLTSYFHGGKSAMLERLSSMLSSEGKKRGTAVLGLLLAAAVLGGAFITVGRNVVMEDDEFQITLPHGTTWEGPEYKPGLNAEFYLEGLVSGGLEQVQGSVKDLEELKKLLPASESHMAGDSLLDSPALPVREAMLTRTGSFHEDIHYYFQISEDQVCDLWFRLDMVTEKEARTAAESFLKGLGAAHAKSPDGRYDLSYLLTDEGSRWLLRDRGELVAAVTTPGNHLWQTARWSPDSRWAAVVTGDRFAVLSLADGTLKVKDLEWHSDAATPIGWGADNRMEFSFVRNIENGLESGTAQYDPTVETVSEIKKDGDCVYREFRLLNEAGAAVRPPWSVPLPADVKVVADGATHGDADLMLGDERIGAVRWVELSPGELSGREGLMKLYSNWEEGGSACGYTYPVGGGMGYELVIYESALRQDLIQAMAEAFLVDGAPAYRYTYDGPVQNAVSLTVGDAVGDADVTGLWHNGIGAEIMYGAMFSLEVWRDGAWETVEYANGESAVFSSIGYLLKPGESREKRYPIQACYGVLPAGRYRIREEYSVTLGFTGQQSQRTTVYGTFTVS